MPLKTPQTPIPYLLTLFAITTISFAFILDNFTRNMSKDTVSLWFESEAISLQQGNYLSSVTKLERVINNSTAVLSGAKLVQIKPTELSVLISIGEEFQFSPQKMTNDFDVYSNFFTLDYVVYLSLKSDLVLFINFKPNINKFLLLIFSAYFFILFFFFNSLNFTYYKSRNLIKKKFKLQRSKSRKMSERKVISISKKLAHDIRSPLSTLTLISDKIENPEIKQLQASVIFQINQIAADLLNGTKNEIQIHSSEDGLKPEISFLQLFEQLKTEYTIKNKYVKFQIHQDIREIAIHAPKFLYACLNNLIQNSVEATEELMSPDILITAKIIENIKLQIDVTDNGKGIPQSILEKLGKSKISYGKQNTSSGSGIGVFNTYSQVKEIGGEMQFESILNEKTVISMILPIKLF